MTDEQVDDLDKLINSLTASEVSNPVDTPLQGGRGDGGSGRGNPVDTPLQGGRGDGGRGRGDGGRGRGDGGRGRGDGGRGRGRGRGDGEIGPGTGEDTRLLPGKSKNLRYRRNAVKGAYVVGSVAAVLGTLGYFFLYEGCELPVKPGSCPVEPEKSLEHDYTVPVQPGNLGRTYNVTNAGNKDKEINSTSLTLSIPITNIKLLPGTTLITDKINDSTYVYTVVSNSSQPIVIPAGGSLALMEFDLDLGSREQNGNLLEYFTPNPRNVTATLADSNELIPLELVGTVPEKNITKESSVTFSRDDMMSNDGDGKKLENLGNVYQINTFKIRDILIKIDGDKSRVDSSWRPDTLRLLNQLELVVRRTGNKADILLYSNCDTKNGNSNPFAALFADPVARKKVAIDLATFFNDEALGGSFVGSIGIDNQFWSKGCGNLNAEGLLDFVQTLDANLHSDKKIRLSIPVGPHLDDLRQNNTYAELDKHVDKFDLDTTAPSYPNATALSIFTTPIDGDPTKAMVGNNTLVNAVHVLTQDIGIDSQKIVPQVSGMARKYHINNTDVMNDPNNGYGGVVDSSLDVSQNTLNNVATPNDNNYTQDGELSNGAYTDDGTNYYVSFTDQPQAAKLIDHVKTLGLGGADVTNVFAENTNAAISKVVGTGIAKISNNSSEPSAHTALSMGANATSNGSINASALIGGTTAAVAATSPFWATPAVVVTGVVAVGTTIALGAAYYFSKNWGSKTEETATVELEQTTSYNSMSS